MTEQRIAGRVSIVTPCLNGATFLPSAMQSIRAQTCGDVEYLVIDGGSRDDSLSIALGHARTFLMPGASQAAAVNFGFKISTGEYFAFLNADDIMQPHAMATLAQALAENPSAPFAYADALLIDQAGAPIGHYPTHAFSHKDLAQSCFICQPATLVRASALEEIGGLDERYDGCFDYDLWIRLSRKIGAPVRVADSLAASRMHKGTKTFLGTRRNVEEACDMLHEHFGYVPFAWVHALAGVLDGRRDLFFDPPVGSPTRSAATLLIGLQKNRRHALRFMREFFSETNRLRRERLQRGMA